jgi:hypothetical protein
MQNIRVSWKVSKRRGIEIPETRVKWLQNLLGTIDQESKVLGHLATFNSGNTCLFQLLYKLLQLHIAIQLSPATMRDGQML